MGGLLEYQGGSGERPKTSLQWNTDSGRERFSVTFDGGGGELREETRPKEVSSTDSGTLSNVET